MFRLDLFILMLVLNCRWVYDSGVGAVHLDSVWCSEISVQCSVQFSLEVELVGLVLKKLFGSAAQKTHVMFNCVWRLILRPCSCLYVCPLSVCLAAQSVYLHVV